MPTLNLIKMCCFIYLDPASFGIGSLKEQKSSYTLMVPLDHLAGQLKDSLPVEGCTLEMLWACQLLYV